MVWGSIPKTWIDYPVVCVASGASLNKYDIEYLRLARLADKCRVIVVNDCYLLCPWADHLHFCDLKWYEWHKDKPEFKSFQGIKSTLSEEMPDNEVIKLQKGERFGFSTNPNVVNHGGNSGYQAVNIAILYGAKDIYMLGYDCKPQTHNGSLKMHWFGDHKIKTPISVCNIWLQAWESITRDIEVNNINLVNITRDTAIKNIKKRKLKDIL